jgi:hypothetical protein
MKHIGFKHQRESKQNSDNGFNWSFLNVTFTSISLHVKIIDLPEIVYLFIKLNTVAIVPLL